jgi:hypothetical protein
LQKALARKKFEEGCARGGAMLEVHKEAEGKVLAVKISGKLTKEDYKRFLPDVERLNKKHGKIRVRCQMHDFHGWDRGALWEDIKLAVKSFADIERLALVGDRKWEAGMALFCKPFTTAKVRYFDEHASDQAAEWIRADLPTAVASRHSQLCLRSAQVGGRFKGIRARRRKPYGKPSLWTLTRSRP